MFWHRLGMQEVNDWALDVIYFPTLLDHFLSWVTVYSPFISFNFHKYGQKKKWSWKFWESKKVFFSKCNIYLCNVFFTLWILSNGFTIHKHIPAYFWYYVLHFSTKISISIEEKCNFTDIFLKEIFLKKIYPHNLKIFFFF